MKKFTVSWIEGNMYIGKAVVLNTMIVEAEDINKVDFLCVLSEKEKQKYEVDIRYCLRIIYYSETVRIVDYGSHYRFIWAEEYNNQEE